MKLKRKQLIAAVIVLLLVPALSWIALYQNGYVAAPGKAVVPPFNLSDRIVSIEVEKNEAGQLIGIFEGAGEGAKHLTGDELFEELYRRKKNIPRYYKWLDVTSFVGVVWVVFGFMAQLVFTARMVVQWYASEKVRSSIVPPTFWWLSLLGSSMLLVYFIWRKEPVGFFGQATGWFIYVRNLWFIYGKKNETA